MDQIPFVAMLGGSVGAVFIAAVMLTGLIGGVQYLADKRYVTRGQHDKTMLMINARFDSQEQAIKALQTNQELTLEMNKRSAESLDRLEQSLRETDQTVKSILGALEDICTAKS